MNAVTNTTPKEYINSCKLEAENYFSKRKKIFEVTSFCDLRGNCTHKFHFNTGYYPSHPLSTEQQEQIDLFNTTILGMVLFAAGVFISQPLISNLTEKTISLYNHKQHLDLASKNKTGNFAYFSIAQDMTDIYSLKAAYINKHAVALFLLITGSAILIAGGFSAAPLLISSGHAFLAASVALGFFTEMLHESDNITFRKNYERISNTAANYIN